MTAADDIFPENYDRWPPEIQRQYIQELHALYFPGTPPQAADPAEAWRDACLDAIATIRAALDGDTEAFRALQPPGGANSPGPHALTTIAAFAVMDAASREGISTSDYLHRLTRRIIMGDT